MRNALIVGIDHYEHISRLSGCVNDAHSVKNALERHADGTLNFANPILMTCSSSHDEVLRKSLKSNLETLFKTDAEIALFYFAGHGYVESTGGYLCTSETKDGDDGVSLSEVMSLANNSPATNRIVVLDSCHSGVAGVNPNTAKVSEISEGVTILTASTKEQYAAEVPGGGAGVFTTLFVDALGGAAANLLGDISPGSVYAHIDQSLAWSEQRPIFKTNVKNFVSLKTVTPPIALNDLHALRTYFPNPDYDLALDPSYEPERSRVEDPTLPSPDPEKNIIFSVLQKLVKVNLVRPKGENHMWHAAMNSKSCELTVLGQHYWRLVDEGRV